VVPLRRDVKKGACAEGVAEGVVELAQVVEDLVVVLKEGREEGE